MNKTEWDASNDPLPMLNWLRERGSERKFRLFACACMRRMEAIYRDYDLALVPAVEVEEARADGQPVAYTPPYRGIWTVMDAGGRDTARSILEGFERASRSLAEGGAGGMVGWEMAFVAREALSVILEAQSGKTPTVPVAVALTNPMEAQAQAALVRDLFGHLFHPDPLLLARLDRTDEVERIARAIYDDRSFAELPVLADALEEAGCADDAVLSHCREPGEHARGCWVIDAILGRS